MILPDNERKNSKQVGDGLQEGNGTWQRPSF